MNAEPMIIDLCETSTCRMPAYRDFLCVHHYPLNCLPRFEEDNIDDVNMDVNTDNDDTDDEYEEEDEDEDEEENEEENEEEKRQLSEEFISEEELVEEEIFEEELN